MVYKRTKSWTSGPNFPVLTFAEYSPGVVVVEEEINTNNLMVVVVIGGKQYKCGGGGGGEGNTIEMWWFLCWRENSRNEVVMEKSRHVLVYGSEGNNEKGEEIKETCIKK